MKVMSTRNKIWRYYSDFTDKMKKCIFCKGVFQTNVTVLAQHLRHKCKKIPITKRTEILKNLMGKKMCTACNTNVGVKKGILNKETSQLANTSVSLESKILETQFQKPDDEPNHCQTHVTEFQFVNVNTVIKTEATEDAIEETYENMVSQQTHQNRLIPAVNVKPTQEVWMVPVKVESESSTIDKNSEQTKTPFSPLSPRSHSESTPKHRRKSTQTTRLLSGDSGPVFALEDVQSKVVHSDVRSKPKNVNLEDKDSNPEFVIVNVKDLDTEPEPGNVQADDVDSDTEFVLDAVESDVSLETDSEDLKLEFRDSDPEFVLGDQEVADSEPEVTPPDEDNQRRESVEITPNHDCEKESNQPRIKKKRTALSLEKKLMILRAVDEKKKSKSNIAREFNVPRNTLSTILLRRHEIEAAASVGHLKRKKLRRAKYEDLEHLLYNYFKDCRQQKIQISGPLLLEKAEQIALELQISDFKASIGWLHNFKSRHEIASFKVYREEKETSVVNQSHPSIIDWHTLNDPMIESYTPENIYSFDEFGLLFKALPETVLGLRSEKCYEGKKSKIRITIGVCVNQTGTDKLRLLVIGKSKHPRCFNNINKDKLPVLYEHNRNSWMVQPLFESFVARLNKKVESQNRKILLLVDHAPPHILTRSFSNVKVVFLPQNSTSKTQPLGKCIIQSFKMKYRSKLIRYYLRYLDEGKTAEDVPEWTLLHAIRAVAQAWSELHPYTISKCWKAAGFMKKQVQENWEASMQEEIDHSSLALDFADYLARINHLDLEINVNDFINVDNDLAVCVPYTRIAESSVITRDDVPSDDSSDDDAPPPAIPKSSEVLQALNTLYEFQSACDIDSSFLAHLNVLHSMAKTHIKMSKTVSNRQ